MSTTGDGGYDETIPKTVPNENQRLEELKCQARDETYCSYAENHPVETAAFVVSGLVGAATLPETGAIVDGVKAIGWKALELCSTSSICWSVTGAGGAKLASGLKGNILDNKKKGDAFRDQIADAFQKAGYQVDTEVIKKTPFGRRVIDIEVTSPNGELLGGIETKTGTSRYTAAQRAKDTWLSWFGYIVNVVRDQ